MSYAGTVIDRYCQVERGRQASLAAETGIHTGNLTRIRTGERDATFEMISKLARELDEDWASELVLAWLRDQTPEHAKHLVRVHRSEGAQKPITTISDLDQAFAALHAEAEHNPELQRIILNLGNLCRRLRHPTRYQQTDTPSLRVAEEPDPK